MQISKQDIQDLINKIEKPLVREWVQKIIDSLGDYFYNCPGSINHHHNFSGGLAIHTWSLTSLAIKMANHYIDIGVPLNKTALIAGCLLQDIGKVECYEKTGECQFVKLPNDYIIVDHKYKATKSDKGIHHIPISYSISRRWAEKLGINDDKDIQHALNLIIVHHGRLEWGSNRTPSSLEGHIGHLADYTDSILMGNPESKH